MDKIILETLKIDNLTKDEIISRIKTSLLKSKKPQILVTPNAGHLKNITKNQDLRDIYLNAELSLADGWPIAIAASIASKGKVKRITGSDLIPELFKLLNKDVRIGIIGGENQTEIRVKLESIFPNINIQIIDTSNWSESIYDLRKLRELIQHNALSIVLLCLGHPKQELIAEELKNYDWVGSRPDWIMCVGATIDFLIGKQKRSPKILSKIGLEWFYRLITNPKKFGARYFNAVVPSLKLIISSFSFRKFH